MKLKYVVITSVDRDDLRDGGAQHFADSITAIRRENPNIKIEVLVPDFRGRMDTALHILTQTPPDVFNHNLETAPRLYKLARPGADYKWSLELLRRYKEAHPEVSTKSGLMVGLGETTEEIIEVIKGEPVALSAQKIEAVDVLQKTPKDSTAFFRRPTLKGDERQLVSVYTDTVEEAQKVTAGYTKAELLGCWDWWWAKFN